MRRNGKAPTPRDAPTRANDRKLYLPLRPFFWTPDQIAQLLEVTERTVREKYLWYDGREAGIKPKDKFRAVNISPADETPEWRVAEDDLIKWLRFKGIRVYERGYTE